MSIPSSFSENKTEYTLTDSEKAVYKEAYTKVFNSRVPYVFTVLLPKAQLVRLNDLKRDASNAAKRAILQSR